MPKRAALFGRLFNNQAHYKRLFLKILLFKHLSVYFQLTSGYWVEMFASYARIPGKLLPASG